MIKSSLRRRNTVRDVLRNVDAKADEGNELQRPSNYRLLSGTRKMFEFEAPDKHFNIYTVTPVSSGASAWVCCKNSKIVTLLDKVGTVLTEVEYPVLINGLDIDQDSGNLWTSGAGGRVMELIQSREPVLRFSVGTTILCLCITQNNQIVIGLSGKLALYDFTGNVILTSETKHNILTLSAADVFLTANTGTLKPSSLETVINSDTSLDDTRVGSKIVESSLKNVDFEIGDQLSELHNTTNTKMSNEENSNRQKRESKNRTRSVVCTPHVVRECPVTNNKAIVDLDRIIDGGNGGRPFILILNNQLKKKHQCDFPVRYLINDVAYDNSGNLTVADSLGSVFLLSGNGAFLRKIFTPDAAMQSYVLGVDKKTNLLWTVFKDSRNISNVKVLRYCKGGHYTRSCTRHSKIYICTRL